MAIEPMSGHRSSGYKGSSASSIPSSPRSRMIPQLATAGDDPRTPSQRATFREVMEARLGFIDYDGDLEVHNSLPDVILRDYVVSTEHQQISIPDLSSGRTDARCRSERPGA